MQAAVVYESMFANTRAIAYAIGAGLAEYLDVAVMPVGEASPASYDQADLVVVGGPTHRHGMSRESTRRAAEMQVCEPGSGLTLEPGARGEGLREWMSSLSPSRGRGLAAAFDTRIRGPAAVTGHASAGITRALRRHGYEVIAKPESFLVSGGNELRPGELNRAREWGAALARRRCRAYEITQHR